MLRERAGVSGSTSKKEKRREEERKESPGEPSIGHRDIGRLNAFAKVALPEYIACSHDETRTKAPDYDRRECRLTSFIYAGP